MPGHKALTYIRNLEMLPHPEGGYYKETYRSSETIPADALPDRFSGERHFSTAIYFLLEAGNFSAFHRIRSDEAWHFYAGDPLEVIEIDAAGHLSITLLGPAIHEGQVFQHVVPAGCWFASRVKAGGDFSLVGCTVAPGFDFADFEMAEREKMTGDFPQHEKIIAELTRC